MSIDSLGKIKTAGKLYAHVENQDGSTDLTDGYIVERTAGLTGGGGYGLFYFESDHSRDAESVIEDTKHPGSSNALAIGTSAGQIGFYKVESGGISSTAPEGGGA